MENKLRNLYALQMIDSHLDELEEMKGDLPGEVRNLEGQLAEIQERLASLESEMRSSFVSRDDADSQILGLKEKLDTYRQQQFAVRNNREYDALTREMDTATSSIARLEKEMEEFENRATLARTTLESTREGIGAVESTLEEKRAALAEVSKATEDEELRFRHEREKIVVTVEQVRSRCLRAYPASKTGEGRRCGQAGGMRRVFQQGTAPAAPGASPECSPAHL